MKRAKKTPRKLVAMILPGHSIFANSQAVLETLAMHMAAASRACSEAETRE